MATNPLHSDSAQEKPLSIHAIGLDLENLQLEADELAKLVYLVSGNDCLDDNVRPGIRAICTLAEVLSGKLVELTSKVYDASAAQRAANVAEFPANK